MLLASWVLECAVAVSDTAILDAEADDDVARSQGAMPAAGRSWSIRMGRRYFTVAVLIGIGVMAIPFIWVLWDLWSSSADPFRGAPTDYFYDLQARAMFHGHLSLPDAKLGIEGIRPRRADLHLFRYFPVASQDARPPVDEQVRRRLDGPVDAAWPG